MGPGGPPTSNPESVPVKQQTTPLDASIQI